jgi:hypothetical protein
MQFFGGHECRTLNRWGRIGDTQAALDSQVLKGGFSVCAGVQPANVEAKQIAQPNANHELL